LTKQEILQQLLNNIPNEFDKSVGSFFYDALMPVAIELEDIYANLDDILPHAFAKSATGIYLDNKVAEQGLTRKPATKAIGTVEIIGDNGANIRIGDKVSADTLTFTITENKVITEGSVIASVQCDIAGIAGNVPIGSINRFPVTLPGIVSVTNPTPTTDGFDAETDDELRQRYFDKVSRPSTSGNIFDYISWAREITGVGGVKVVPLWNGNGTVKVMIINSNGAVADSILINKVAESIEQKRPIGANVTVESATPVQINISAVLTLKAGVTITDIKSNIQAAITKYLKDIAFKQDYVSYAYIGSKVLSIDGILDYENLTVNTNAVNVDIAENEVPILGTLEVSTA